MSDLPMIQRKADPVCTFPDCGRPMVSKSLCKAHRAQQMKGMDLIPVGDPEYLRASRRAFWAGLDDDERRRRLAKSMHKPGSRGGNYERSPEWRRRMSESRVGKSPDIKGERNCFGCGVAFKPSSGPQTFCSIDCRRLQRRAIAHGITLADLALIEERQNNRCAVCRRETRLVIDHDHITGAIRGLLCMTCNTGLGKLGDSAEYLRRALAYLER